MDYIRVRNATNNNLKNIDIDIPLGQLVVFVGKSGSGKSTLAADVIVGGALAKAANISVPVLPALFRQRVAVPTTNKTVGQYLGNKSKNSDTVLDFLLTYRPVLAELFSEITQKIGISHMRLVDRVSDLSLTRYNRLRFIKFLIEAKSNLLVVDELAGGMSFSEANKLASALLQLIDSGYSILAIEHSLAIITHADFVVEMGPDAGTLGGLVTFCGSAEQYKATVSWRKTVDSIRKILPPVRPNKQHLKICSINYHGLHIPELTFPFSCIVNIIGSSGVGKSSMLDIIYRAFDKSVNAWKNKEGIIGDVAGKNYIRRPYLIDQSPIGNNSMSTPATYTKIMDMLRDLYTQTAIDNKMPYTAADFSYNAKGKCPECNGRGVVEILIGEDTLFSTCSACEGKRFRKEIENVLVDGLSIGDVLVSHCGELSTKFSSRKTLQAKIGFLANVGLSYLTLGQPSASLSGGESQRIKITKELAKKLGDRCLFILDTPSKGLHSLDLEKVLIMLRMLVTKNNGVVICDNNPYFVLNSDWVIALDETGIIYQGTPKNIPNNIYKQLGLGMIT